MRSFCLGAVLVITTVAGCAGSSDPEVAAPAPAQDMASAAAPDASVPALDAGAPVVAPLVVRSMANIGDSISQGYDADDSAPIDMDAALSDPDSVFHDNTQYSWVQGTDVRISSVARHFRSLEPTLKVTAISRSGAELVGKIKDRPNFEEQTALLVAKDVHPDLVWVLLGGNDVCNRPKAMTTDPTSTLYSVDQWTTANHAGLATLAAGLDAGATVRFVSMPRVDRLFDQAGDASIPMKYGFVTASVTCHQFWSATNAAGQGVCPIVTTEGDPARRAAIGARIDAYNDALATEVHRFAKDPKLNPKGVRFQTDWHGAVGAGGTADGSMGTFDFAEDLVSKRDCFHPSILGQASLANMVLNIATWE